MRSKLTFITALVILVLALAVPSQAQWVENLYYRGKAVGRTITADDTSVGMKIRYIGAAAGGGEVTVAADGNISLTVATVADATTECPVAGATYGGVIDVSDGDCDTAGEVCDAINFSDDWQCVLIGLLRSDTIDANTLLAAGITAADDVDGYSVNLDTDAIFKTRLVLAPTDNLSYYLHGPAISGAPLQPNVFTGVRTVLNGARWTNTFGAGTSVLTVYGVKADNKRAVLNAAGTGFTGGSETVTTLYSTSSGATTVEKEIPTTPTITPILISNAGEKVIVAVDNSAAQSSITMHIFGYLLSD